LRIDVIFTLNFVPTKPSNLSPPKAQFVLVPTDDSTSGIVGGPSVEPNLARNF
jgi:hypothetical protein